MNPLSTTSNRPFRALPAPEASTDSPWTAHRLAAGSTCSGVDPGQDSAGMSYIVHVRLPSAPVISRIAKVSRVSSGKECDQRHAPPAQTL